MSRPLPYSRKLVAARAEGERPWLVVVTMGDVGDWPTINRLRLPGSARIWVPDDYELAEADLRWALGMDILLAPYCDVSRATEFAAQLWRAKPATLWQVDAGFTATRLFATSGLPRVVAKEPFVAWRPSLVKIGPRLHEVVARAREHALLVGDEPLFDDPKFAAARTRMVA